MLPVIKLLYSVRSCCQPPCDMLLLFVKLSHPEGHIRHRSRVFKLSRHPGLDRAADQGVVADAKTEHYAALADALPKELLYSFYNVHLLDVGHVSRPFLKLENKVIYGKFLFAGGLVFTTREMQLNQNL
jgi:hypothetical protein